MKTLVSRVLLTGVLALSALGSVAWAEPRCDLGPRAQGRERLEFHLRQVRERRECRRQEARERGWRARDWRER